MAGDVIPETIPVSSALNAIPADDVCRSRGAFRIVIRMTTARGIRFVITRISANSRAGHLKTADDHPLEEVDLEGDRDRNRDRAAVEEVAATTGFITTG